MPRGLRRFQESGQSHFVTLSCCHRQPHFATVELFALFVQCLEDMRVRFDLRVYGYVVMPEHVHLLLSEPARVALSEAIHYLKLSFAKRTRSIRSARVGISRLAPKRSARTWGTDSLPLFGKNGTATGMRATTLSSLESYGTCIEIR